MKSYIIYLPDYPASVEMANRAVESALKHGWDAELWTGVDGSTVSFEDLERFYRITACSWNKKCYMMLRERPGVRGCFLSHWNLWHRCRDHNQDIGIFEHDVLFMRAPKLKKDFQHVLKLEGFDPKPARPAGIWYEGARAYILRPSGADRLIRWVQANGCLPADVNIGLDIVEIEMQDKSIIALQNSGSDKTSKHQDSFTWNLGEMQRQQ